jgi:lysylphosphatidylglycerol synthetase-like protein (DUF2156 family)
LNFSGIVIGIGAFLIIGLMHPVIIKTEYHFGKGAWWAYLVPALLAAFGSVMISNVIISSLLAVLGFTLLWSIKELFEQEKRVHKGWYPANPKRTEKTFKKS